MKKKSISQKLVGPIAMTAVFAGLVSCAGDTGGGGSNSNNRTQQEQQADDQGTYKISFNRLNGNVAPDTEVRAFMQIKDNDITVYMKTTGAPASIVHLQHIHAGSACPDQGADKNGDGFVDVVEGAPSYGNILVGLDTDLSTYLAGATTFPFADGSGDFNYKEKATYLDMMNDLHAPDILPNDAIAKLPRGQGFNLPARTVVLHGVMANTDLPDTVASLPGLSAHMTLPIACGTIEQIEGTEELEAIAEMATVDHTSNEGNIIINN